MAHKKAGDAWASIPCCQQSTCCSEPEPCYRPADCQVHLGLRVSYFSSPKFLTDWKHVAEDPAPSTQYCTPLAPLGYPKAAMLVRHCADRTVCFFRACSKRGLAELCMRFLNWVLGWRAGMPLPAFEFYARLLAKSAVQPNLTVSWCSFLTTSGVVGKPGKQIEVMKAWSTATICGTGTW